MLLTLSVLLIFDTWERNICIWEKLTSVTHFLLFKFYIWGLFCRLGFGVTFFKLLHIKLDMNFLFTCTIGCVIHHLMCWCKSWMKSRMHQLILWSIKSKPSWSLWRSLNLRTQVMAICHYIDHWLSHIQAPIMIVLYWMWL
jgi:hypothetical protein